MNLNLNISIKDIISIIKQLPITELQKLNNTINFEISSKKTTKKNNIQSLILKAPTWTDKQYDNYLKVREHINKSRLL